MVTFTSTDLMSAENVADMFREPYIYTGYRLPNLKYSTCLRSLFAWHNETVNIWSHILGTVYFLSRFTQLCMLKSDDVNALDKLVCGAMLLSCAVVMILSTLYHLFNSHTKARSFWLQLDINGIALTIVANYSALIYYGFYHDDDMYQKQAAFASIYFSTVVCYMLIYPKVLLPIFFVFMLHCFCRNYLKNVLMTGLQEKQSLCHIWVVHDIGSANGIFERLCCGDWTTAFLDRLVGRFIRGIGVLSVKVS